MKHNDIFVIIVIAIVAAFLGDLIIHAPLKYLRSKIETKKEAQFTEIARYIGMVERCLYVLVWYLGLPEFVAAWLVFKVAVEWKGGWNTDNNKVEENERTHARWNLFVLGNGLSLLVTIVIVLILQNLI